MKFKYAFFDKIEEEHEIEADRYEESDLFINFYRDDEKIVSIRKEKFSHVFLKGYRDE